MMILGRLFLATAVLILGFGRPLMADAFKDCVSKNAKELSQRAPSQADVDAATRWILGLPALNDSENPAIMKIQAVQKTTDEFKAASERFFSDSKQVKTDKQAKEVFERASAAAGDAFWNAVIDPNISELIVNNFGAAGQELLTRALVDSNIDYRIFFDLVKRIEVAHWMCR